MQYVRSISGSVSKTWNSINPATLSGAIDVIVVEQEDGSLACSPFHVRFGKFSLLRPSDKKVEFTVNGEKQNYAMKLGEGGEAFFVFETTGRIPEEMQTSPLVSPAASPQTQPTENPPSPGLNELEPLDLATDGGSERRRAVSSVGSGFERPTRLSDFDQRPSSGDWSGQTLSPTMGRSNTDEILPSTRQALSSPFGDIDDPEERNRIKSSVLRTARSASPPPVSPSEAVTRAINLSKKLWGLNIPTQVTDRGDLMLDMTGYKSSEEDALRAEVVARRILSEELEGNYDIGALIGADEKGNLWIYSSMEAKQEAGRAAQLHQFGEHHPLAVTSDAASDPGYHSDDGRSDDGSDYNLEGHQRRDSDSALGLTTPPESPNAKGESTRSYAKTLRLTSGQLQALDLKPGANTMSFSVNRATCQASMFYWKHDVPIVISDIDGTITKSDALGHVLTYIGRDWTHSGVAKLYTDIVANGYNIFYLTSRSVGQADTTRAYLNGIVQDGYRIPKGPVIMSPDRTMAALRREIYLRKPEVFKMACLRDIMNLFNKPVGETPFYAGFGNRLTDALSYRSVNIPSTRIFTINSNAEVVLDLLTLNKYKTGYTSMQEIVDHYFPPVSLLVHNSAEEFTDFNYWRERPLELDEFSDSDDGDYDYRDQSNASVRSEDERDEDVIEDLEASYYGRDSIDETGDLIDSMILDEGGNLGESIYQDDDDDEGAPPEDEENEYAYGEGEEDEEVEDQTLFTALQSPSDELEALNLAGDRPRSIRNHGMSHKLQRIGQPLGSHTSISSMNERLDEISKPLDQQT